MRVQDLITYVQSLVNYTYYAYSFPTTAKDDSAIVVIHSGMPTDQDTGVKRPVIQVLVRGTSMQATEAKSYEIFEALANKKEVTIGNDSITQIFAQGSAPVFIGKDENERATFSLNFLAVIRPR